MNLAHLHLILTHVPVLGVAFAALLLAAGLARANRSLQRAGLAVLVLTGLAAGAAFLTGEGAEDVVGDAIVGADALIGRHESAGIAGLIAASIAGVMGLVLLIQGRKGRPFSRALTVASLVAALATSGLLAWVANLGGQIGHPEIRSGQVLQSVETGEAGEGGERH